MAVTSFVNSTGALSSQAYSYGLLESTGALHERHSTRLGGASSRLVRDSNGSIHLIEKTPAEVVGEKILRPLIDRMSALSSYVSSLMQYLPSFPSLPGAYAERNGSPGGTGTMHFPSKTVLVSCLDAHPLTGQQNSHYLSEKGITDAVADFFADKDRVPIGVNIGVTLTLHDLNEKLKLPQAALGIMQMNLAEALKDCAIKAETPEENPDSYIPKPDL